MEGEEGKEPPALFLFSLGPSCFLPRPRSLFPMPFDPHVYRQQVSEAVEFLGPTVMDPPPEVGIILGTGLGRLADEVDVHAAFPYEDIPHFPVSTVESHHGRLLAGINDGVGLVVLQGRFHLYEGYDGRQVTFPVRVLGSLGVKQLLIANAAGGLNPDFRRGDLMLVTDHINLQGTNPLTGPNDDGWGPRFPDMSEPYDAELRRRALEVADEEGIALRQGVYVAVTGPNLETRAEYRFLRQIGADAVGMSTVPEVIVARHMGMRCLAVSVITDECFPDTLEPVTIGAVLAAAAEAEPKLTALLKHLIARLGWTS
jgi:purine-nucleoside phosphorylase